MIALDPDYYPQDRVWDNGKVFLKTPDGHAVTRFPQQFIDEMNAIVRPYYSRTMVDKVVWRSVPAAVAKAKAETEASIARLCQVAEKFRPC